MNIYIYIYIYITIQFINVSVFAFLVQQQTKPSKLRHLIGNDDSN